MASNGLVSSKWLNRQLQDMNDNLVILDATMAPIGVTLNPDEKHRIPTAQFYDIENQFSDLSSSLPHTIPTQTQFEDNVTKLGITNNSTVVIYDDIGVYSAARAWWMFKYFGHQEVFVLNGGLPLWMKHGHQTLNSSSAATQPEPASSNTHYRANVSPQWIASASEVLTKFSDPKVMIIDARSKDRFDGIVPEPRKGLRQGHIPNAFNIPYTICMKEHQLLSKDEMLARLRECTGQTNLPQETPMIFSCGSGITACIPMLALYQAGFTNLAVYDGSWSDWGRADLADTYPSVSL